MAEKTPEATSPPETEQNLSPDTSVEAQVATAAAAEATPPVTDPPPQAPAADGSTSIFEKAFGVFLDELRKRFDDAVPVKVLAELAPFILSLHALKEVDVDFRLQVQSRFDDVLRRLGLA
jgi:hypothetical protein